MFQRQATFSEAVRSALVENYCNFDGRASRSQYWWFCLFNLILGCAVSILFASSDSLGTVVDGIVSLALFLPSLGLQCRRLHDIGKSGWWMLVALIPLVGWIILLVWNCKDSDPYDNQYGPVPLLVDGGNGPRNPQQGTWQ